MFRPGGGGGQRSLPGDDDEDDEEGPRSPLIPPRSRHRQAAKDGFSNCSTKSAKSSKEHLSLATYDPPRHQDDEDDQEEEDDVGPGGGGLGGPSRGDYRIL